jgi:non-specific serine/threonine protein kinase
MDLRPATAAILAGVLGGVAACGGSPASPAPSVVDASSVAPSTAPPSASALASATAALPRIGGTWTTGTPTRTRRAENAAVAVDGLIYLPGGLDNHGVTLDTFESFDPATGTWTTLPKLPEPRDHMGLAVADGQVYLSGGGLFFTPAVRSGLWRYDPKAARWTALAPMPGGRWQHASVAIDGKIYVVGGVVQGPNPRALWAYDIAAGTWQTDLAPMPTEREHLTAVAANGRLIAIGGRKTQQSGAVEEYDPATNTWRSLPDLPTPRGGSAAGLIGNVIHVAGGENLNAMSTYPQHEALDLATMTWSSAPDLPTKRHGLASAVVDGRWYVLGGGRAAGLSVSDVVEVYTP